MSCMRVKNIGKIMDDYEVEKFADYVIRTPSVNPIYTNNILHDTSTTHIQPRRGVVRWTSLDIWQRV